MEKSCNININVELCILITEEEFEARERYYEELYASGGNIEKSSEGFSTEGGAPKFVRKIGEKLGFSVSEIIDENNNSYGMGVILDSTLLENLTSEERVEMVKERVKELGGQVFTAYDNNGNAVDVTVAEPKRKFKNKSGKKTNANIHLTNYNRNLVKQEAVVLIDELITTASFKGTEPAKHPHDWLDNNGKNEWDVWETYIQDKNKTIWKAKLRIANTIDGEKILYDVFPIEKAEGVETFDTASAKYSISQTEEDVNPDGENVTKLQQSVSETESKESEGDAKKTTPDAYSELDSKAKTYLRKIERRIGIAFDMALGLDLAGEDGKYMTTEFREFLREAVRPITNEYLATGDISQSTINEVFENHYKSPNGLPASLNKREKMDALGMLGKIIDENWDMLRNIRNYTEEAIFNLFA